MAKHRRHSVINAVFIILTYGALRESLEYVGIHGWPVILVGGVAAVIVNMLIDYMAEATEVYR